MKTGWKERPFEECAEVITPPRKIPRKEFLDEGDFAVVSQEAGLINGYWDSPSDVVRASHSPVIVFGDHTRVVKYVDFDFVVGADGVKILKPCVELLPRFFYYAVDAIPLRSLGYARHFRLLRESVIPIPPLPEQRRIVAILDEAFEGINSAQANAEKCLRNTQELFESWLNTVVDGNRNRWSHVRFGEVTNLRRGHNPPKSQFAYSPRKGYVRFWQIRDGASDDKAVYVPDSPKLHKVNKSDILLVAYRHVGRCFRGVEGAFNVALCCVSNANPEILSSDFLYHMIPTKIVRGELLKHSERSLIPSMSVKHLAEIPIPLPPLEEQLRISKQIEAHKTVAGEAESIIETKLSTLDELKASLLHQAFTGQL